MHVAPGQKVLHGDIVAEAKRLELDTLQLDTLTSGKELSLTEIRVRERRIGVE